MPANISRWFGLAISGRKTRFSRCRNRRSTPPSSASRASASGQAGCDARTSQRDATALLGGPIAGVVDLDRLKGQREIRKRLPSGRDAFHEILDFLQITARPFFLEADVLPAGLPIDLFGEIDAWERLLVGLVAHHVRVRRDVGEQRAAAGIGFDQVAYA